MGGWHASVRVVEIVGICIRRGLQRQANQHCQLVSAVRLASLKEACDLGRGEVDFARVVLTGEVDVGEDAVAFGRP